MSQSDTPLLEEDKQPEEDKQQEEANNSNQISSSIQIISKVIKVWLSIRVILEALNNKAQQFTATFKIDMYYKQDLRVYLNQFSDVFRRIKETKYEVTDLRQILMTDISLPIDVSRIFVEGSCVTITHLQPPKLKYDDLTNLVHICYEFRATLSENLEVFAFPFDRNYLNVKLAWNARDFFMLNHFDVRDRQIAAQILPEDNTRVNSSLILYAITSKMDEIAAGRFHMLSPCVDYGFAPGLGSNKTMIDQSLWFLLKLRVNRKPWHYVLNLIFPMFIIVSVGFSIFAVNDKATRLEISLAILLIFTAFQSSISDVLPDKSQMTLISWYIFIAYIIQTILIVSSCVGPNYDEYFLWSCLAIWDALSIVYISLCSDRIRKIWQFCFPRLGWKEAGAHERRVWAKNATIYSVDEAHYNHVPRGRIISICSDANPLTESPPAPIKHQQNKPAQSTINANQQQKVPPLLPSRTNSASMTSSENVPKQVQLKQSQPELQRNHGSQSASPRSKRNVNRRSVSWNFVDSDEGSLPQNQDTPQLQSASHSATQQH